MLKKIYETHEKKKEVDIERSSQDTINEILNLRHDNMDVAMGQQNYLRINKTLFSEYMCRKRQQKPLIVEEWHVP